MTGEGVLNRTDDGFEWRSKRGKREWLTVARIVSGEVQLEDGPADPWARRHEAVGGAQSVAVFLSTPAPWVDDYPELAAALVRMLRAMPP